MDYLHNVAASWYTIFYCLWTVFLQHCGCFACPLLAAPGDHDVLVRVVRWRRRAYSSSGSSATAGHVAGQLLNLRRPSIGQIVFFRVIYWTNCWAASSSLLDALDLVMLSQHNLTRIRVHQLKLCSLFILCVPILTFQCRNLLMVPSTNILPTLTRVVNTPLFSTKNAHQASNPFHHCSLK